jgi:hypothetical protein
MHLLIGKLPLLDYCDGRIERRYPEADGFARVSRVLARVRDVERVNLPDCPTVYAFHVERIDAAPLLVLWERRDAFAGECAAPVTATVPWSQSRAHRGRLGNTYAADAHDRALRLSLADTPLVISGAVERDT